MSVRLAQAYLFVLVLSVVFFHFFPWVDLNITSVGEVLKRPSTIFLFGTDNLGRDFLARLLMGGWITLLVATGAGLIVILLGVFWGSLAAMGGRWVELTLSRILDVFTAIPQLVSATVLALVFENLLHTSIEVRLIFIVGLTHWFGLARLVQQRSKVEIQETYIEAARALGASQWEILYRHLRLAIRPLVVNYSLSHLPQLILAESFLSFIGLGVESPETSWGLLLQEGWRSLGSDPHLIFFPSVAMFLTVLSLNRLTLGMHTRTGGYSMS